MQKRTGIFRSSFWSAHSIELFVRSLLPNHYHLLLATLLNYVLYHAVHHGYVERWQDWPYSNAEPYLEQVGRKVALRRWREYPLDNYGKDWDPPEL